MLSIAAVPQSTDRRVAAWPLSIIVAVAVGTALGVGTQMLQGALPDEAGALLANSGGAWISVAFVVGAAMTSPGRAAVAGAVTLVTASVMFYEAVGWFEHVSSGRTGAVIWAVAGLVAGPVFGAAGHAARTRRDLRPGALGLVAGLLIAEGMNFVWWVGVGTLVGAGVVEMTIGGALAVLAVRLAGWDGGRLAVVAAAVGAGWVAERTAVVAFDWLFAHR